MLRCRLRAVALAFCCGWLSGASTAVASEAPAAFCYFTTDAKSYRDDENVKKFADLVQAELLTSNNEVRWVDRGQIDTALGELELQAFGKVDASAALRLGHWLKADVLIKGHLTRLSPTAWSLTWEIIDLDRADVLEAQVLQLPTAQAADGPASPANLREARRFLAEGLTKALRLREQLPKRVLVAPLYFRNADSVGRIDYIEQDLRSRFEVRNAKQPGLRYLQFPRAENALEEVNLIASGLVAGDTREWQRIADYYVWGTYREVDKSGVAFPEVQVEVTVEVWNGRDEPKRLTHRGQVKALDALLDRVVTDLEAQAREKQVAPVATDVRKRLAEQLRVEIRDLQEWVVQVDIGDFSRPADDWLRMWRQCIRTLATAAFLDPTNEVIRRELLIETTRTDLRFTTLPGNREFWRVWQCSDAWKAHCQQFGYSYVHEHAPRLKHRLGLADNRIDIGALYMYLKSSETLLVAMAGKNSHNGYPVPPGDVPKDTLRAWQDEISRDHVERIKLALTKPAPKWTTYGWLVDNCMYCIPDPAVRAAALEALWPVLLKDRNPRISLNEKILRETFLAIGRPETAERMIEAALQKEAASNRSAPPRAMVVGRPDSPAADAPPELAPIVVVPGKTISLKKHFYARHFHALGFAENRLWMSVGGQSRSLSQGYAVFTARTDGSDIRGFTGLSSAGSQVTSMLSDPGGMWLTLDGDGVCRVDHRTQKVDRYTAREGLPSPKMFALAKSGKTLYAAGGQEQRGVLASLVEPEKTWAQHELSQNQLRTSTLPSAHVTRLACDDTWLAAFCHQGMSLTQILLRKWTGGEWKDVGERLHAEYPQFSHFNNSWRVNVAGLAFGDGLLWIATTRGIVAYDPHTDAFPFSQLTPWEFTTALLDDEVLWLTAVPFTGNQGRSASEKNSILVKFNMKSRAWESQIPLSFVGTPLSMAQNDDTIWVGMGNETGVVVLDVSAAGRP